MGMDTQRMISAIMSQPQAGVQPGRKAFSKAVGFIVNLKPVSLRMIAAQSTLGAEVA